MAMLNKASNLIEFISTFPRTGENLSYINAENLPDQLRWADFIANLSILKKNGILNFSVSMTPPKGLTAEVHLFSEYNASEAAFRNWKPQRSTVTKLTYLGLTKGRISEALTIFNSIIDTEKTDDNFYKFVLEISTEWLNVLCIKDDWSPSEKTVSNLVQHGIVPLVITEYKNWFVSNKVSSAASWDDEFEKFCKIRWSRDNRNPNALESSLMSSTWEPSKKTISDLITSESLTHCEINLLMTEYRLYWTERGESRVNWDGHFKWWVKSRKKNQ